MRSATPKAAACSRSRSAAPARRFARGTTCVSRCATSTSTAALEALNLTATRAADFIVETRSSCVPAYVAPSTASTSGSSISSRRSRLRSTCAPRRRIACMRLRAASACCGDDGERLGTLERGESALVPAQRRRVSPRGRWRAGRARQSGFAAVCRLIHDREPATLRIDLDALARNFRLLRDRAAPAECAAVVKADAYGLGVERVVRSAAARRLRAFLRRDGWPKRARCARLRPTAEIGVFEGALASTVAALVELDARPVLNSSRAGRALARPRPRAAAHRHRHEPARPERGRRRGARDPQGYARRPRARLRHDASRVRRRARASAERRAARALRPPARGSCRRHRPRSATRPARCSAAPIAATSCGPASRCTAATRSAIGRTRWSAS